MLFSYTIKGMHCQSCVNKIKSALSQHANIASITLNPPQLQIIADSEPKLSLLNANIATAGHYQLEPAVETHHHATADEHTGNIRDYYPIFLIAAYITGISFLTNTGAAGVNWMGWMAHFMAGFFLVFSAFKLLDIRGFAEGYASYDLLAKHWHGYGYLYPFIELGLGILYLTAWLPGITESLTILIMGFSSLGVINSLIKNQQFKCACLGTLLTVPLSTITLIEDLTMVGMAILTLLMM